MPILLSGDHHGHSLKQLAHMNLDQAGLDVKVVYDSIGNLAVSGRRFRQLKRAGGRVFRYSLLFTSLVSANYRSHRELAIDVRIMLPCHLDKIFV